MFGINVRADDGDEMRGWQGQFIVPGEKLGQDKRELWRMLWQQAGQILFG
jgi:hypothetical protein